MTVHLTAEQEKFIKEQVEAGRFSSPEEVVSKALETLRQQDRPFTVTEEEKDAVRKMIEFVEENRVRLEGITVKELINEGRRF